MEEEQMIADMYCNTLNTADLSKICKKRGFSPTEVSSLPHFKTSFFSEKGIRLALSSLTRDELVLLHILNFTGTAVDISFFERLYTDPERDLSTMMYQSFTSRYKDVFKKVRSSLVRRGVLLFTTRPKLLGKSTKMERYRFMFPEEFVQFLPSPFDSSKTFTVRGNVREDVLRRKITQLVSGKKSQILQGVSGYDITISDGKLFIGVHEFRVEYLENWQMDSWKAALLKNEETRNITVEFLQLVIYAFSQLKPNERILPDDLANFLRVHPKFYFNGTISNNQVICEEGWKWGYLSKYETGGKAYYRLSSMRSDTKVKYEDYLTTEENLPLIINIKTIPYEFLEVLTQISKMKVVDSQLEITPHLISIGSAAVHICRHPLTLWLKKSSSLFKDIFRKVDERWGKQIVHTNLLVAKVKDLSLLVKIQQSFPDHRKVVRLQKDFIAFPYDLLPEIQMLIKRSGHVIKKVKDD